MTEAASKINTALREAEKQGGWPEYAVYMLGTTDTGDDVLDGLLAQLYDANESVHRRANQLALRYDLDFYEGE
jgi:hypothetical protein